MAKKLVAVTNIRHNNEDIEAGEPVDTSPFHQGRTEGVV